MKPLDFNQYGTRRGNHEVMMRGTFANIRIKNHMVKDPDGNVKEGGLTLHQPDGVEMPIYDAAMMYASEQGRSSSSPASNMATAPRATGPQRAPTFLGVRAVIAQSFERIHRSNLVGMGVIPLQFQEGQSWQTLGLKGDETITINGLADGLKPRETLTVEIVRADGSKPSFSVLCRIDTLDEIDYYKNGGILHFVLRNIAKAA